MSVAEGPVPTRPHPLAALLLCTHLSSLSSARTPELFPEGTQKMQQLANQVGLNPSQGAMLPKSGECCLQPHSGLQVT
jgi:hypothetical protein